ncbi:transglutaminase family protein [Sessilibacter sp. MAH4]
MKRLKITHKTRYDFTDHVELLPHTFRLRPREGHDLRIESSKLTIFPPAVVRWYRDVESNSVATASFTDKSNFLTIESEIIIQKYDLNPLDFLVSVHAVNYPFTYRYEDTISLSPYLTNPDKLNRIFTDWVDENWKNYEKIQTFSLLERINRRIFKTLVYVRREEEGVQSAEYTVASNSGSCRDFASLFMAAAQRLGFAARFVSGYIYSDGISKENQSTHAWAEVFIPGAGWKGFDPTYGTVAGVHHIATAVARRPESVPPISGSFYGSSGASMNVEVLVTEIS